jgi:DUF4097 and DUF4098 domain-containing protein YvlB
MESSRRAAVLAVVAILGAATAVTAQIQKQYRYTVGEGARVTVINQFGPISVQPGGGNQVIVNATLHSKKVEIDQTQSGNRVDLVSHLLPDANQQEGQVDYELIVPPDTNLTLHSSSGTLHAERLRGDLTLEGAGANVDVHVKTLNGKVTLTNIEGGHVEITSVSGNITLNSVDGPLVEVNSSSGKILYDGDFGYGGEYSLMSHTGDIDATAPEDASIDVIARSMKGKVENDFPLQPKHTPFAVRAGTAFAGTMGKAASSVKLLSFSGRIHLKKR